MPMVGIGSDLRNLLGQRLDNRFQHHGEGPGIRNRFRILFNGRPLVPRAPLRFEAAEHIDELRREPDMGHDRNAALREEMDGVGHALAAFNFDGAAFRFLHHPRRIVKGLGVAFLIGAKRHVNHNQRPLGAPHHRAAMQDHEVKRHRQG